MNAENHPPRQATDRGRQNIPEPLHPEWGQRGAGRADPPPRQQPEFAPDDIDVAGGGEGKRPG
ncbi:hypothetical protein [Pseudomonas sp. B1-22]|uniref:hypothetical protein n=1 Tax=Pseudomonas sp. B1-22 TaxID=3141456 RepID=UPI003D26A0AC